MTEEEYNDYDWYMRGYASSTEGTELPLDATSEQRRAWMDGLNTAVEEDENSEDESP